MLARKYRYPPCTIHLIFYHKIKTKGLQEYTDMCSTKAPVTQNRKIKSKTLTQIFVANPEMVIQFSTNLGNQGKVFEFLQLVNSTVGHYEVSFYSQFAKTLSKKSQTVVCVTLLLAKNCKILLNPSYLKMKR